MHVRAAQRLSPKTPVHECMTLQGESRGGATQSAAVRVGARGPCLGIRAGMGGMRPRMTTTSSLLMGRQLMATSKCSRTAVMLTVTTVSSPLRAHRMVHAV